MADDKTINVGEKLNERFAELPKIVQDAITSADVKKKLRELSDTHKLHLDQWEKLENEVMFALLGFQPIEQLQSNIQKHVDTSSETAAQLASDISRTIFEPIRQELERELEHPEAKAKEETGVEQVRQEVLGNRQQEEQAIGTGQKASVEATGNRQEALEPARIPTPALQPPAPAVIAAAPPPQPTPPTPVIAATPPAPPQTDRAVRAPTSSAYKAGEPSTTRKNVHDDPYRESPA